MLNPALAQVLARNFGRVRVYNEGEPRIEQRRHSGELEVVNTGESYNICCPICKETRHRCSVSYLWLTKKHALTTDRRTNLINCYNEGCEELWKPKFYQPLLEEIDALMLLEPNLSFVNADEVTARASNASKARGDIRLPFGCQPLSDLPSGHPAIRFIYDKYPGLCVNPRIVDYLSDCYSVYYTDYRDNRYPAARNRIIFPLHEEGRVVGWQGRRIDGKPNNRWIFPPGCTKTIYNAGRVSPVDVPVFNEGIINAIACGPCGVGIFGKTLKSGLSRKVAGRWRAAIVATDPETFVPDNRKGGKGRVYAHELRDQLLKEMPDVRLLPWPEDILDIARRSGNGEDIQVPDAAELGFSFMRRLIRQVT